MEKHSDEREAVRGKFEETEQALNERLGGDDADSVDQLVENFCEQMEALSKTISGKDIVSCYDRFVNVANRAMTPINLAPVAFCAANVLRSDNFPPDEISSRIPFLLDNANRIDPSVKEHSAFLLTLADVLKRDPIAGSEHFDSLGKGMDKINSQAGVYRFDNANPDSDTAVVRDMITRQAGEAALKNLGYPSLQDVRNQHSSPDGEDMSSDDIPLNSEMFFIERQTGKEGRENWRLLPNQSVENVQSSPIDFYPDSKEKTAAESLFTRYGSAMKGAAAMASLLSGLPREHVTSKRVDWLEGKFLPSKAIDLLNEEIDGDEESLEEVGNSLNNLRSDTAKLRSVASAGKMQEMIFLGNQDAGEKKSEQWEETPLQHSMYKWQDATSLKAGTYTMSVGKVMRGNVSLSGASASGKFAPGAYRFYFPSVESLKSEKIEDYKPKVGTPVLLKIEIDEDQRIQSVQRIGAKRKEDELQAVRGDDARSDLFDDVYSLTKGSQTGSLRKAGEPYSQGR